MKKIYLFIFCLLAIFTKAQTLTLISTTPIVWGLDSIIINSIPATKIQVEVSQWPKTLMATDDSTFSIIKRVGNLDGQSAATYQIVVDERNISQIRYTTLSFDGVKKTAVTSLPWKFTTYKSTPEESIFEIDTTLADTASFLPKPAADTIFEKLITKIELKNKEFEKLQLAKTFIKEHKITTANARTIINHLGFENTRFELLMLLVEHCKDPENLESLADLLQFDPTKNSYLERVNERAQRKLE